MIINWKVPRINARTLSGFVVFVLSVMVAAAIPVSVHPEDDSSAPSKTASDPAPALAPHPATAPGQSATLMPDGHWLLVGGSEHPGQLQVFDPLLNRTDDLPLELSQPRSGHSATLLSDGTVLIFGGVDAYGTILDTAERYDPTAAAVVSLGRIGLEPRAYHTAMVLTDGRVLIVAGEGANQELSTDTELYNPTSKEVTVHPQQLEQPRLQPAAALMPDGTVLISGGTDQEQKPVSSAGVFNPLDETLTSIDADSAQQRAASLTTRRPRASSIVSRPQGPRIAPSMRRSPCASILGWL